MNKNILIVEDEKNILDVIKAYLIKESYKVFEAMDGQLALDIFNNEEIHLIILDLMLPKISGQEVCRRIRTISNVPIIMLTAKSEEDDKIEGLDLGADDYVTKPFSPRELMSRVKAILRRSYNDGSVPSSSNKISTADGRIVVEVDKMRISKDGILVDLTPNEFKVLSTFFHNPEIVLSREQLIESAFGYEYEGYDRTIDSHIKNIRQKLEDNPKTPVYIVTIYGVGYVLRLN